jgi:hypothetical protein
LTGVTSSSNDKRDKRGMGKWGRESRAKLVHHPLHEKMKQAFFDRFVLVLSYSKYYTKNLVSVIIAETYFLIQRLWKKFFFVDKV